MGTVHRRWDAGYTPRYRSIQELYVQRDYMRHLQKYPKFNSTVKNLQVGNGELVATLFVIPFVYKVGKHMFEVYTLVSEIQQNMDIILGVKNMFEIEGEISCCTS